MDVDLEQNTQTRMTQPNTGEQVTHTPVNSVRIPRQKSSRKRNVINYAEDTDNLERSLSTNNPTSGPKTDNPISDLNLKSENITDSALDVKCGDFLHQTNIQLDHSDTDKIKIEYDVGTETKTKTGNANRKKKKAKKAAVKIHKCETCEKQFPTFGRLNRHVKEVHTTEKLFHCQICKKKFCRNDKLNTHMRIHSGDLPYKCQYCKKRFAFKSFLTGHIWKSHKIEEPEVMEQIKVQEEKIGRKLKIRPHAYICDLCNRTFKIHPALTRHKLEVHTGVTPFVCEICKATYKYFRSLSQHVKRAHAGEKLYKCKLESCGKIFQNFSTLRSHKKSHETEPKQFNCEHCNKDFLEMDKLIEHKNRVHKNPKGAKGEEHSVALVEKPFICETCAKCFRLLAKLKVHSKIHDQRPGQTMYGCEVCGKLFRTRDSMNAHKKLHTDGKSYECKECGKTFTISTYLKKHMLTHKSKM